MPPEIGLLLTPENLKIAQKVASLLGMEWISQVSDVHNVEHCLSRLINHGVKCVITRGRTADIIQKTGRIPVVPCNPRAFDVISALQKVPKDVSEVVYISYTSMNSTQSGFSEDVIRKIGEISGHKLVLLKYRERDEYQQHMDEQLKKGKEWFIGSKTVVDTAKKFNRNGVELIVGEETIFNAFNEALNVLNNQRAVLEEAARLNKVIDIARQGVVTLDSGGVITAINAHAASIIPHSAFRVGRGIGSIFPLSLKSLKEGRVLTDEVCVFKGRNVILNQSILTVDKNIVGAVMTLQSADQIMRLENKIMNENIRKGLVARWTFEDILECSKEMKKVKNKARSYSRTGFNILILGETGTGKEMFAHALHLASKKRKGPFIAINCSALPESLLESELFGYEPGAFTGARKEGKPGLFELANEGTIFLDEINSLNYELQSRLLRVIEEKQVMRIGSDRFRSFDARVIASSNQDLWEEVEQKRFREDLYFRLNELELVIPPLRERVEDIPLLVNHLLAKHGYKGGKEAFIVDLVSNYCYGWPGNVRELDNTVKRIISLMDETPPGSLMKEVFARTYQDRRNTITVPIGGLDEMENELIKEVGCLYQYDLKKVAKVLNVSIPTVWRRLKKADNFRLEEETRAGDETRNITRRGGLK